MIRKILDKLPKKLMQKLGLVYPIDYWMIDDNTVMPIACGSKATAQLVVKKEFNGEEWRIYGPVRKWRCAWDK